METPSAFKELQVQRVFPLGVLHPPVHPTEETALAAALPIRETKCAYSGVFCLPESQPLWQIM